MLGRGSFADVYLCTKKSDGTKYAMKCDRVNTPPANIRRERVLLKKLQHPAIVEFIGVFYHKSSICMVLALCPGGNLSDGVKRHWSDHGSIPFSAMPNIVRQMLAGVAHLHANSCVHRDIKGENYLMDRKQITDSECKIVLSDFGSVTTVDPAPEKRLKAHCGSKEFWSPEFYRLDYKEKVDVWAIGVDLYRMTKGRGKRLPFENRPETENKQVRLSSSCPEKLVELFDGLLNKNERLRLSAGAALEHTSLGGANPGV